LGRFAQNLVGGVVGIGERYRAVVLAQHAPSGIAGARDVWRGVAPVGLDFAVTVVEDRGANLPGAGRLAHFRSLLKHSVNRDSDSKSTA
jgi:hypothetical protein